MNDFRRSGQRDDRRRRVLHEEVIGRTAQAAPTPPPTSAEVGPVLPSKPRLKNRYSEAARMEAQPRITDLVPRRRFIYALWLVAGLLVIAGLETVYHFMPQLAARTTDGRIAAFDLDSEGSLGSWFSSMLLVASSLAALLVWSLRRQRPDDYHGRYRVWAWAAMAWMVMSVDESCSLHEGFKEMMALFTGHRLWGDGSVWWVAAYALPLSWIGLRLLLDMRGSQAGRTALVLTGICWVAAVLTQLDLTWPQSGARGVMLEEGCEMLGNMLLLFAMTYHARYLISDNPISGKSKSRRKAKNAEAAGKEAAKSESRTASTATAGAAKSGTPATAAAAKPGDKPKPAGGSSTGGLTLGGSVSSNQLRADSAQGAGNPHRKLSKAERRAMRRQNRQDDDEEDDDD